MIAAEVRPRGKVRKARPLTFLFHSVIGLNLCALLGMIFLTGTIATVSNEIEWLANPAVRSTVPRQDYRWGRMWDGIRRAAPQAHISGIVAYETTDQTYFARSAELVMPGGVFATAWVDPGSGHVNQVAYGKDFPDFMRAVHYRFLSPKLWLVYLCTACGPLLLVMIATGLLTYKKFWRGFLRMPRVGRGMRTLWGDLHRLIGLWSIWFMLVIASTGSWYLFEDAGPEIERPPPVSSTLPLGWHRTVTGRDIDGWVGMAERALPGLSVRRIGMPYAADGAVTIEGQWHALLVRERANAVYIDPVRNRIIRIQTVEDMTVLQRLLQTADPLHFGSFGGLATKLIWFVFGGLLVVMAVSGMMVFHRRTAMAIGRTPAKPWFGVNAQVLFLMSPTIALYVVLTPMAFLQSFRWQGYPQIEHYGPAQAAGVVMTLERRVSHDEIAGDNRIFCVETRLPAGANMRSAVMTYGSSEISGGAIAMTDAEGSLCASLPDIKQLRYIRVNVVIDGHYVSFWWNITKHPRI